MYPISLDSVFNVNILLNIFAGYFKWRKSSTFYKLVLNKNISFLSFNEWIISLKIHERALIYNHL